MGRIIAIDYGKKRTGLAVTDPLQIIATALDVIESEKLISYLRLYFQREAVDQIVIGLPKNLKNEENEMTALVRSIAAQLQKTFPDKPLHFLDERFTTTIAHQTMITGGMKKKDRREKGNADKIAATILLQDFLVAKK
ncbi:MAG TPA: Holliday junction resolvase RuvX [Cyclobacteriaceae bacterium]|nr:Holliday junction resolvase RuvX [Cyclobacteriaceae bacterium]